MAYGSIAENGPEASRVDSSWTRQLWRWTLEGGGLAFLVVTPLSWVTAVLQQLLVADTIKPTHYWHGARVLYCCPLALTGIVNGVAAAIALLLCKSMEEISRATRGS